MNDYKFFQTDFKDFRANQAIEKHALHLKENFKLSDYEALKIAIESQRNDIFYRAFLLSNDDLKAPTALEGIAIALGMTPK